MPDFSVVVILCFGDGAMFKPFFFHVTESGGVPLNVLSRTMDLPFSTLKSLSFFTKTAGSEVKLDERKGQAKNCPHV